MRKLFVNEPISGGILLSYKCSNECRHCMYACSYKWATEWFTIDDAEKILLQLSSKLKNKYSSSNRIGVNYGIHFSGGEPFLNFELLLKVTELSTKLK